MNNQQYWCSPELSEKLEKLGVESQFDFWWEHQALIGTEYAPFCLVLGQPDKGVEMHPAYHWSDLCIPENAKRIWGDEYIQQTRLLAYFVSSGKYKWDYFLEEYVQP